MADRLIGRSTKLKQRSWRLSSASPSSPVCLAKKLPAVLERVLTEFATDSYFQSNYLVINAHSLFIRTRNRYYLIRLTNIDPRDDSFIIIIIIVIIVIIIIIIIISVYFSFQCFFPVAFPSYSDRFLTYWCRFSVLTIQFFISAQRVKLCKVKSFLLFKFLYFLSPFYIGQYLYSL